VSVQPGSTRTEPVESAAADTVAGRLSFVVPTKNSARTLGACLRSLRAQTGVEVEVIVVDNHSDDATPEIARRHADQLLVLGPERSTQRNAGLTRCTGEFVAFIDSDMVLDSRVAAEAVARFTEDAALGGLIVDEHVLGSGFLVRCRRLEKELRTGDPAAEAARIFRRPAVQAVGGFDETLYAGEDWELADRVAAAGWATGRLEAVIQHDEGRIRLREVFRKKRYYGANLRHYVARADASRRPLAQARMLRDPRLLRRPHVSAGLFLLKGVEVMGLLCGAAHSRLSERN
jgi:glycosyltransferase involved in cell wall biosynthesis